MQSAAVCTQEPSHQTLASLNPQTLPATIFADAPGVLELPEHWNTLADCYVKAGRREAAITMYENKLSSLGLEDVR